MQQWERLHQHKQQQRDHDEALRKQAEEALKRQQEIAETQRQIQEQARQALISRHQAACRAYLTSFIQNLELDKIILNIRETIWKCGTIRNFEHMNISVYNNMVHGFGYKGIILYHAFPDMGYPTTHTRSGSYTTAVPTVSVHAIGAGVKYDYQDGLLRLFVSNNIGGLPVEEFIYSNNNPTAFYHFLQFLEREASSGNPLLKLAEAQENIKEYRLKYWRVWERLLNSIHSRFEDI